MLARGAEPLARCVNIAGRQNGVLAARQAHAQGVSAVTVQRLVRAGHWKRVRPSVYALWIPADPAQLWRQRLMAGTLWLGDGSAVSHRAASVDWELDGVGSAPIELSTTRRHQSPDAGLVVHRVRALPAGDIVVRTGLRVTSLPRTLLDLCAVVDPLAVELALESALRRS